MSGLVGNATCALLKKDVNTIVEGTNGLSQEMSKQFVQWVSALGRKWVPIVDKSTLENVKQHIPYGSVANQAMCDASEISFDRYKYNLVTGYHALEEKVSSAISWICSSSTSVVNDVVSNPKIMGPVKGLTMSLLFVSGTVLILKATDELFEAIEGKEPKKKLLSALKLGVIGGMSFYTGYNFHNLKF